MHQLRQLFCAAAVAAASFTMLPTAQADWVHEGQAQEGRWTAGFRAGLSIPTQETIPTTDAGLGPAVNLQVQYGLNRFFRAGMLVEWDRHTFDNQVTGSKVGTSNTITVLPTLEYRPGHFGAVIPYLSTGIGANINMFDESRGIAKTSMGTTFAFRLAGGLDYALSDRLMLNAELAWKRNRGGLEVGGVNAGSFDASSANLLFGVKYTF
ncbi:MAG: outer membrane beta-barrel protein [Nitrospiraceae bacterium]